MTDPTHVVTAFLRHGGRILLLRRSDDGGTYRGQWGGVSGYAEGNPDEQVWIEIEEETGLSDTVDLVRRGRPVEFHDDDIDRDWVVHPYCFDSDHRCISLSDEHEEDEWVHAPEIRRRETVPELWTAYERVTPAVRTIAADDERGSAALSIRALEILRDQAAVVTDSEGTTADATEDLSRLAERLIEARPSMAALRNRIARVMATADGPSAVESVAADAIDRAVAADEQAARLAAERIAGDRVLTLSRSGTVLTALQGGDRRSGATGPQHAEERVWPPSPKHVFVAESRPAREGVDVAATIGDRLAVTVHTDAAVGHVLAKESVDAVVVGADTVLPDGRVVNKTGTRTLAAAAAHEDVPVLVITAADKVSFETEVNREYGPGGDLYDGDSSIDVLNPTFDVTPSKLIDYVVTDRGVLDPAAVSSIANEHRANADWSL